MYIYHNMDQIELIISEINNENNKHLSLIEQFELQLSSLPYSVIACKFNCNNYSNLVSDEENIAEFPVADVNQYFRDSGIDLKYSSIGLHLEGERKRPHIHYNCIVLMSPKSYQSITNNASQHRKRWYDKKIKLEEDVDLNFKNLTFQFTKELDSGKAKYSTLAYPLKEGHHSYDDTSCRKIMYSGITPPLFEILLELGTTIYNKEVGLHLRQEKCEERKQIALTELFNICEANKSHFNDLRSMARWLDINYIDKLELGQLPDPKNYKTNLQKIACKLKFLNYSDLI